MNDAPIVSITFTDEQFAAVQRDLATARARAAKEEREAIVNYLRFHGVYVAADAILRADHLPKQGGETKP